jgi:hypothetical protein
MARKEVIVVDGANVAFAERLQTDKPKMSNLVAMRQLLEARGYTPIIIVDASLRHVIDDPAQLTVCIQDQSIRQTPACTDADYFVLKTSEENHAQIVTNDEYQEYRKQFPWIGDRRVPFMIINGKVELYEQQLPSGKSG